MSRERLIFAIDAGTSSLKAAILDKNLTILESARQDYAYHVVKNMGVEIDPEVVWQALAKASRKLSAWSDRIAAIGICTFCPALTAMDREGRPLRDAIIHLDRRTYPQARRALARIGEKKFLEITGNLPYPGGVSLTSLLWLKMQEPEIYKKTVMFGHMNTFLHRRLAGRWVIDPTNASMTGLYETVAYGDWSRDMLDAFDVSRSKLPEVLPCEEVLGGLTGSAAEALGLPARIPVIMGGGDTACAAYGAGSTKEGEILNITGSSELLTVTARKPWPSRKYNLRTHVLKDMWVIFIITVSGIALEWFRQQFCREMDKRQFFDDYLPEVFRRGVSSEVFLPHICGHRYSLYRRKGVFSGLTLETTREDLLCAIANGVMKPMKDTLKECEKRIQLSSSIFLTGGGASEAIKSYKERTVFAGYNITIRKNCALIGVAKLALRALQ